MSEPNSIVGVLTACVECIRDFNVAERVHSEIIGLNTRQACCLVLISDITAAAAGKWGEALEARHVLQKCIIKKLSETRASFAYSLPDVHDGGRDDRSPFRGLCLWS
jgi:hypothetical protein